MLKEHNLLLKKIKNGSAQVSVIGTGYIGLPLILNIAKKFKRVVGYDINKIRINSLKKNIYFNKEFSKNILLNFEKRITFTNHQNNLENSDIFILCIPTPINNKKRPELSELKKACKLVSKYLKNGSARRPFRCGHQRAIRGGRRIVLHARRRLHTRQAVLQRS